MNGNRGFTLIELIMVLVLISILAGIGSSLFLRTDGFNARLARDQILASTQLAQQKSLAIVDAQLPLILRIRQLDLAWQVQLLLGSGSNQQVFQDYQIERNGGVLSRNNAIVDNGDVIDINYTVNGAIGAREQWLFSATNGGVNQLLCISSRGVAYGASQNQNACRD